MRLHSTAALILSCFAFCAEARPAMQGAGSRTESIPVPHQNLADTRPANLRVLPADISGNDLDRLMHRFRDELGAPCGYCHAQDAKTRRIDYASDENPVKETARLMILMTGMINDKYLARFGERPKAAGVTCGDCHRGQIDPPDFEPKSRN